jgi:hypothetical protein
MVMPLLLASHEAVRDLLFFSMTTIHRTGRELQFSRYCFQIYYSNSTRGGRLLRNDTAHAKDLSCLDSVWMRRWNWKRLNVPIVTALVRS